MGWPIKQHTQLIMTMKRMQAEPLECGVEGGQLVDQPTPGHSTCLGPPLKPEINQLWPARALMVWGLYISFTYWDQSFKTCLHCVCWAAGFLGGSVIKNLPAEEETWVPSLGLEDPLEEGVATYSSFPAWRIPSTEESGGLWSAGSQRVRQDWSDLAGMQACWIPSQINTKVWASTFFLHTYWNDPSRRLRVLTRMRQKEEVREFHWSLTEVSLFCYPMALRRSWCKVHS